MSLTHTVRPSPRADVETVVAATEAQGPVATRRGRGVRVERDARAVGGVECV